MASLPVRRIEAHAYVHATEDEERVAEALRTACPAGAADREVLEGQFGNPIVHLGRRVETAPDLHEVWERWADAGLLRAIAPEADARLDDEGVLHVRLDKQKAYAGLIALARDGDAIDVRVKLKAYPAKPEILRRVAHDLLQEG